jgi:hypothetical protein
VKVNVNKADILGFKGGGGLKKNERWHFGGQETDVVNKIRNGCMEYR